MGKISGFKRIIAEDFGEDDREVANKIGFAVNSFAEEVIRTLNGNVNEDNLNRVFKTLDITVDATGEPKTTTQFKSGLTSRIEGLQVIKAQNLSSSTVVLTGAPFITYSENGDVVTIEHVTGLVADNKYRLKIEVVGS